VRDRSSLSRALSRAVEFSLALPAGALIALVWANLALDSYERFSHAFEFLVNDVGMAFFFALAAKEVVEATSPGAALHTWRRAALPVAAAAGGMAVPALTYLFLIPLLGIDPGLQRGWAIPCATDIAFSYLVAKAIFRRHPVIPFLLLLAIVDDALGLIILALFYPVRELRLVLALAMLAVALVISFALRRRDVKSFWPYVVIGGSTAWAALFFGGLHPALALVPIVPFMPHSPHDPGLFVDAPAGAHDTLSDFEHWWKYPVQGILLLFGLVNAGVPLQQTGAGTWLVLSSILVGKPLGIMLLTAAAVGAGLTLPPRLGWRDLAVASITAGIGFTVALFFAVAAFPDVRLLLAEAKMGALLSVAAAPLAIAAAAALKVGRFRASAREDPSR
jgi:Na+:H+ antiporter, NhaA family